MNSELQEAEESKAAHELKHKEAEEIKEALELICDMVLLVFALCSKLVFSESEVLIYILMELSSKCVQVGGNTKKYI